MPTGAGWTIAKIRRGIRRCGSFDRNARAIGNQSLGACAIDCNSLPALRQIRVEEAEHVRVIDHADAFFPLQLGDTRVEFFHLCPVYFRPPMMLRVVAVVEEEPVVNLAVTAHAPRDWFVGIGAVVAEVAIQITEAMAEVKERQEEHEIVPVRVAHHGECDYETGELEITRDQLRTSPLA